MEYRVIYANDDVLMHYGVKGMRWGVRKARSEISTSDTRKKYDDSKRNYKMAKKAYNKAYNNAYNYSARHPIGQFTNKKKQTESDRRWDNAMNKAEALNKAQRKYKQAKQERKQQIKDVHKDLNKKSTAYDRFMYNDATRRNAAKYIVDNNMSMQEATKRANAEARRNTAVILAAYGAVTIASLYGMNRR